MNRQVQAIDDIIEGTRPVFQKYGIRKAILFGSFARGRQTRKSDIDLILVQETDKRYFDRFDGTLYYLNQNLRGRDINQKSLRAVRPSRNTPGPKRMESQTLRRQIIALLRGQERDARDLSQALGLKEKEVYEHLVHVARSVASSGGKFIVTPSQCLLCGYVFQDRRRLTRPSRCPQCKRSKLQNPSFSIA